jgi:hypothetical protein
MPGISCAQKAEEIARRRWAGLSAEMDSDTQGLTVRLIDSHGLAVGPTAFSASSGNWSIEVSRSPWVDVSAKPPVRIVWDGADRRLTVERRLLRAPNGAPVWRSVWTARDVEEHAHERAVCKANDILASVLIAIGYWHSDDLTASRLPHPQGVGLLAWEEERRTMLATYLRSGRTTRAYFGVSYCRFRCADVSMGSREFTDGRWVWPEGLVHYVEGHSIGLPEEFLAHAAARSFALSPQSVAEVDGAAPYSFEFWQAWCDRNVRCEPEARCVACTRPLRV